MKIKITGKQSLQLSNKEIRKAVNFFMDKLVSSQLKRNLTLRIHLMHDLEVDADVIPTDDEYLPRNFKIRLNKNRSVETMLMSLAHECVHLKQFAKREFDCTLRKGGMLKWKGELIKAHSPEEDFESYIFSPWEVEANGLMIALIDSYYHVICNDGKHVPIQE